MARQPKQVHIFLFRQNKSMIEYALFQRADSPFCRQGICGGLEGNETLEEGARREIFEEAGISDYFPLYSLESISYLPDNIFDNEEKVLWGNNIVVIPMYFFAMPFNGKIKLSDEHIDVKWLSYDKANETIMKIIGNQNCTLEYMSRMLGYNQKLIELRMKTFEFDKK